MASAALHGRYGTLRFSSSTSATTGQAIVAELRNYTLTAEGDLIDVTNHDSSGWREVLQSWRRWSWEADIIYLSTGAGQGALRSSFSSATPNLFYVTFQQTTAAASKKYQGQTYLTGWTAVHDNNDAVLGTLRGEGHLGLTRTA